MSRIRGDVEDTVDAGLLVDRQNKRDFFLSSGIAPHVLGSDKAQYVSFPGFSNAILLQARSK